MKIGFDAKRLFNNTSGLGNYSRTLVGSLAVEYPGDTHVLFTPKRKLRVDFLPAENVRVETPRGMYKLSGGLWRTVAIAGLCKRERLDIYHGLSHELPAGIEKTGVKSVVTMHDLIFMRHPELYGPVDAWIHTRKARYACRTADAVIAISRQTRDDVVELLGVPPEKVHVVYQGINEAAFSREIPHDEVERELAAFALPEKFILCVGTVERRKNQMVLLKALARTPEANLVIVGRKSGGYYRELDEFAKSNGLSDRVRFLSGVTDRQLACLYKKCLFVAYMSIYEGFGLPIVEALGNGRAVLTSSGGCFSEAAGKGALYAPCADDVAVASAMSRLWNDGQLRKTLAEAGKEHIKAFSGGVPAVKVHGLYESLLSGKR